MGEVVQGQVRRFGQHHRPVDHVFQFAHVAMPGVIPQPRHGPGFHALDGLVFLAAELVQEVLHQQRYVFHPFPQGRGVDREDGQPVVEVLPEAPAPHRFGQIGIGGRDEPHLHPLQAAPDGLDFPGLQHPQQFGLQGRAQGADFVQEQGALVGLLEFSDPLAVGPGEGPFFMAEQFAFQQIFRNGRAVDGHEGLVAELSLEMNGPGDQFLAGAAFSLDQNGDVAVHHLAHQLQHLVETLAPAHHVREAPLEFVQAHFEMFHLFPQSHRFQRIADGHPHVVEAGGFVDEIVSPAL